MPGNPPNASGRSGPVVVDGLDVVGIPARRAPRPARTLPTMLRSTLDGDNGLAYISSTQSGGGAAVTSVELSDLAEEAGVEALHSLVLDFDRDGRLLGVEVVGNAGRVLPEDLLADQGHDERAHRRRADDV